MSNEHAFRDMDDIAAYEAAQLVNNPNYDPAADPVIRRTGLGGSDMAVVLNLSPFKSALELWGELTGQILPDPNIGKKKVVRQGKLVEDPICQMFAEDMGFTLQRYHRTPRHNDLVWPMAHPDRRVVGKVDGKKAVVEAKLTNMSDAWGEPGTDQIAAYYLPQVHQEMWLTNSEICYVPVWFTDGYREGIRVEYYVVERDGDWIDILTKAGNKFWQNVQDQTEPDIDYNDSSTQRAITKIYTQGYDAESFIQFSDADLQLTNVMTMFKDRVKMAQGGVDAVQAEIEHRMGNAQFARLPDGRWWKRSNVERKGFTVEPTSYVKQALVKSLPKGINPPVEFYGFNDDALANVK